MQTNFPPKSLDNPRMAEAERILRRPASQPARFIPNATERNAHVRTS